MNRIGLLILLTSAVFGMNPGFVGAAFWDAEPTPTAVPTPTIVSQPTPARPKPRPAKRLKKLSAPQPEVTGPAQNPETILVGEPTPTPTKTSVSKQPELFSTDHMKGRWGIGKGNIDQVGPGLSARYWGYDNEAYDFTVAFYDHPNPGSTFNSVYTTSPNWAAGLSLGIRRDLSRPVEDVRVQGILNLEYSIVSQENNDITTSQKYDHQNISLGLGTGFEAFLPFWKNISVEGQILLRIQESISSTRITYNPAYYSGNLESGQDYNRLSVFWDADPLTLLNLSVHFYF